MGNGDAGGFCLSMRGVCGVPISGEWAMT